MGEASASWGEEKTKKKENGRRNEGVDYGLCKKKKGK